MSSFESRLIIDQNAVNLAAQFKITGEMGFGKVMAPIMLECDYKDGQWGQIEIKKYGPITLDPTAKVFHYGQEIFEGLKAYKNDADEVFMFRPDKNAKRFNKSAKRMCMPNFPEDDFVNSCLYLAKYCKNFIPKRMGESLYLRPFMIATDVHLGIKPSNDYKFLIIASPVANYFSSPNVKVAIERKDCRAAPGGTGAAKTGGNYAASLQASKKTLDAGCDQTMWLDAKEHRFIEEMSGMNFMCVIKDELYTPALTDTILEGVTRESILELAKLEGIKIHETKIDINVLLKQIEQGECTEAFVCGTASVIVPIDHFLDADGKRYFLKDARGKISQVLKQRLLLIQSGREPGPDKWIYKL